MGRSGSLKVLWSILFLVSPVFAQPALVPFDDCTSSATRSASDYDPNARINVSAVYAQVAYPNGQKTLRVRAIADTAETVLPSATASSGDLILSTLFTKSFVLTFSVNSSQSWFCDTARPSSPLPSVNDTTSNYCPISPGQLAWAVDAPLHHDYNLTSIITRIRIVDPSSPGRELTCIDINSTPIKPGQQKTSNVGYPQAVFWLSVGLTMGYWVAIGAARISSAWSRGVASGPGWSSVRWAGTVFASAVSAERLSTHSALLRYATPSYRDIIYHTQWCAALAMVAVQWPTFAYPILANTAWSTLVYNITLDADDGHSRWNPWTQDYSPPSGFADQFADPTSPLYLDASVPNNLYTFPSGTKDGMQSFAYAVGIRPKDLFSLCLKIWLAVVGAAILVSTAIWFIDWFISSCTGSGRKTGAGARTRGGVGVRRGSMNELNGYTNESGPASVDHGKEGSSSDAPMLRGTTDEEGGGGRSHTPGTRSLAPASRRRWWHYRLGQSSFHGSVLQGNLVRLLVLFHFPITIFSTYEFSRHDPSSGISSIVLAAVAFASISVLIPALLIAKLALTPTKKLYDATRTLLAYGPLYSHYAHGSQMFAAIVFAQSLAIGVTVGAGQGSGTTQAIVLLVIEVVGALATSIWLPWGERASMGVMSFLYCVARIITAVLLIILSPLVSVGNSAGGWIAYAIIVIQAIVYAAFLLMLFIKIVEGFIRLFGRVPFDKATHSMDSGLLGALSQAGCCGARRKSKRKGRRDVGAAAAAGAVAGGTTSPIGKHTPTSSLGGPPGLYQQPGGSYRSQQSHVGQLSFLKPEQAFQPYREDADDESGFIMGAWADGGYQPVANTTLDPGPSTPEPKSSGFARVGGGRARYDDPFSALPSGGGGDGAAVAAAATGAAAGAGYAASRTGHTRQQSSFGAMNSNANAGLPPGAMAPQPPQGAYNNLASSSMSPPRHTRVQSHSAMIENIGGGALVPPRGPGATYEDDSSATGSTVTAAGKKSGGGGFWQRRVSSTPNQRQDSYDDDTFDPEFGGADGGGGASAGGSGNRSWFGRLLHRSEGDAPSAVPLTQTSAPSSFSVVRAKRPQASSAPARPSGGDEEAGAAPKSFVVVRPNRTSLPSGSNLSPPTTSDADKRASA